MYNKVILMGRITHDLELKTTPSGANVCSFSIAVDRRFQQKGEEKKSDFFNIVAWRQQAEFVSKYFQKGKEADGAEKTLQYYDVVNFARKLKCPFFFSFGYNDDTCSPTSTYSTFNEIKAPKKLAVTPTSGHWRFPETNDEAMEWMGQQAKQ